MLPAAESLGRSLGSMLSDGASEVRTIDQGEDLCKATGNGYHKNTSGLWVTRRGDAVDGCRATTHPTHKPEVF